MSAQPTEAYGAHPRTQDEIGAALPPSQRMAFYRDMGSANEDEIAGVLRRWRLRLAIYNNASEAGCVLGHGLTGTGETRNPWSVCC
ncbi:hypothetical protein [Streptacidiphilus sp. EB129]|uniref:hypothetical protein n=1 Tax=Streptacidiphilus sp. EB129 TaxID=3156262 RepID=UPI003511EE11